MKQEDNFDYILACPCSKREIFSFLLDILFNSNVFCENRFTIRFFLKIDNIVKMSA